MGEGRVALALLVTFIQRSAWKVNSANFAFTASSEVSAPRGAGPGAGASPRCDGTRTPGRTRRSDQIVPFAR